MRSSAKIALRAMRRPGFAFPSAALLRWLGIFSLALALGQSARATAVPPPEQPSSITVALDDNYPPYSFRDQDGRLQGILKDTWTLWSQKTGIPVKLQATEWDKALQNLQTGRADVIDTIFQTAARSKTLDFSRPYASIEVPIFFHKSIGGISDVSSLRGFTVGVKEGDADIDWLMAHGIRNFKQYPNYEALIRAAGNNEIRVFVADQPPALYYLTKFNLQDQFRDSAPLYSGQFHWATRKGDGTLHQIVARGFAQITPDERRRIRNKWVGRTLGARMDSRYARYAIYLLLIALAVTALLILWNRMLRRKVLARTAEVTEALEALGESERYNRMLFENSALGLALCRMDGVLVDVNPAYAGILGRTVDETVGLSNAQITPPDYADQEQRQLQILGNTGHYGPYDKEYRRKDGHRVPVRLTGTLIEKDGERYIWSCVEDITRYKAAEQQIEQLAYHDALTGLPNRRLVQDRFLQATAYADRAGTRVALLFLDLDNFKTINDSLGHQVGDALLQEVAARLGQCVRDTDTISRQGGDEFLILLPDLPDADATAPVLVKIRERLQQPVEAEGHELATSVSIGIALYPDDGDDFDTLLKKADTAMYRAKDAGRNAYRFFDEQMNVEAVLHLTMRNGLRRALDRGEFVLHYQPQIALARNKVTGVEALIRWQHPELGMVPPARFIPVAEESGLIVPIGEWVMREACRQAVAWKRAGLPEFSMAVNLSAVQFKRGDVLQTVVGALEESGFDPHQLELEMTESILIHNTESVLSAVERLKRMGVKLSIDDFGTGYSSLSYLKRFAVDRLKIDQSFVRDLAVDPDDAAIVRAIIQMARSLGLTTIAEGVEDAGTLALLAGFGCDEAQGFHYSRPMPPEDLPAFLAAM